MKIFIAVKLALLPFVVFWALLAADQAAWAVWAALALALAGQAWRLARRQWMPLETGGLVLFAALALAQLAAPGWLAGNALWLSYCGLGIISLVSLAIGRPWTADYSRLAYPNTAATPQFRLINAAMTGLWGGLFVAIGLCRYFVVPEAIITGIVIAGTLISIFGPKAAIALALRRLREAQQDFHWPAPDFSKADQTDCDVAIVGAGIGGLTAAALLADAGRKVMVFDQHVLAGGYCHSYVRKAHHDNKPLLYRFDAGPHDFSGVWPGGPVASLLERLGVADHLHWQRVNHCYHVDGLRIDVPFDWRDYVALLGRQFPESAAGIRDLFDTIHAIFTDMYATGKGRGGIPGMPATTEELLAFPKRHPAAFRWMNEPFDKLVAAHVSDPAVVRVLKALSGYLSDGAEPLTCFQMVPIFGYYFKGGYYPQGGSGRLADVLVQAIRDRGGEVHLKSAVRRISVAQGRATGVVLDGNRTIRATAVLSNADIQRTFLELIEPAALPEDFRRRLAAAAPATSAFSVHLGLDFVPDIAATTHIDSPMNVGLAMMSALDPGAAPDGHATLKLITLVPHEQTRSWFPDPPAGDFKAWRRSADYQDRKQKLGDTMIAAAETIIPGLSQHIVYRSDASPVTYARYDWASAGSIYGVSSRGRLKGSRSPLRNLVIAGGGNAGAGIEAVLIAGAAAAETLVPGLLSQTSAVRIAVPDRGMPAPVRARAALT